MATHPPAASRPQPTPFHWRDVVDLFSKLIWPVTLLVITLSVQKGVERISAKRAVYSYLANGIPNDPLNTTDYQEKTKIQVLKAFCNEKDLTADVTVLEKDVCPNLASAGQTSEQRRESAMNAATAASAARPQDYLASMSGQQATAAATLQEASRPVSDNQNWFTVIGTVPATSTSLYDAAKLAEALQRQLAPSKLAPVQVYKTKISNSYALTIGGPVSQDTARTVATQIRSSGIVSDAFWQPDREWAPISIANLKDSDAISRRNARDMLATELKSSEPAAISRMIRESESGDYRHQLGVAVALDKASIKLKSEDIKVLQRMEARATDATLKSALNRAMN